MGLGFSVDGFGACGVSLSVFLEVGALYKNVEVEPWGKNFATSYIHAYPSLGQQNFDIRSVFGSLIPLSKPHKIPSFTRNIKYKLKDLES